MSDVPDLDYNISQDFTAAYKVSSSSFVQTTNNDTFFLKSIFFLEIYHLQEDADDRREARTHTRDRRSIYPRAFLLFIHFPPFFLTLCVRVRVCVDHADDEQGRQSGLR
jgi:hypothetical protein